MSDPQPDGCHAPPTVFQLREASFDEVSQAVNVSINDGLDLAVSLCRDDRGDASPLQVGKDEVSVVSLVGEQDAGLGTGLVHDRRIASRQPTAP
jgi:hypothetical protein